jgi:Flp pilus assembly protein TadG
MSPVVRRSGIRPRDRDAQQAERGSSALELVLVTPVLIALLFGIIQTGLVWNARHVAGAAAQHGARLARTATALQPVSTGSAPAGEAQDAAVISSTLSFLRQTGGGGLREPTVTITHELEYVTVTVSATTLGVLPGTTVRIVARSRTPLEGFRP